MVRLQNRVDLKSLISTSVSLDKSRFGGVVDMWLMAFGFNQVKGLTKVEQQI
ncbi:hypothetical protein [Nostoc sp.]|uniref:hypothetical protein n=1 Tax=Nostoc sp. TaxID=1180 RepID=UPI002FFA59F9